MHVSIKKNTTTQRKNRTVARRYHAPVVFGSSKIPRLQDACEIERLPSTAIRMIAVYAYRSLAEGSTLVAGTSASLNPRLVRERPN